MGYRLDVKDVVTGAKAYGSKYYGYISDNKLEQDSLSYYYLLTTFGEDYPGMNIINVAYAGPKFILTAEQFRLFYAYYIADLSEDIGRTVTYDEATSTSIYLILYTENNKEVTWS